LRVSGCGSALNFARQLPNALSGIPQASQYSALIELAFYPGLMVRAPKSLAITFAGSKVVGHLVVLTSKLSVRTDRFRTSKKQVREKWTLTKIIDFSTFQTKFPVTAEKIPVPRNIFPVNCRRELSQKWLQHNGFLL
jgi:hypothetical protein